MSEPESASAVFLLTNRLQVFKITLGTLLLSNVLMPLIKHSNTSLVVTTLYCLDEFKEAERLCQIDMNVR